MITKKLIIFLSFCYIFYNLHQTSFALDFDKDGIDDVIYVNINRNQSLSWRYFSFKEKKLIPIARFGQAGDHLIPGIWGTINPPTIGTISVLNQSGILWNFNSTNTTSFEFGSINNLAVSGIDINGDGIFEPVRISQEEEKLKWDFLLKDSLSYSIFLGTKGDVPFIWKLNQKQSTSAVLEYNHIDFPKIKYSIDQSNNKELILNRHFFYNRRPSTIIYAGKTYLVIPHAERKQTTFSIFRANGRFSRLVSIPAVGEILYGNFSAKIKGEQIAVHSRDTLFIANLNNQRIKRIKTTKSIAVDSVNINSFGSFNNPSSRKLSATCHRDNPQDGYKRGFIWKPNSDTQRFAVLVLPNEYTNTTQEVEIFAKDGGYIKSLRSKGCANPDDRGPRCAYQDREYTGEQYKSLYQSIYIKATKNDGNCTVFFIENPAFRVD